MGKSDLSDMHFEDHKHWRSIVKSHDVAINDVWEHIHINFKKIYGILGVEYIVPETDGDEANQDETVAAQQYIKLQRRNYEHDDAKSR